MAINLRVIVPESTTNYILNPSPRYATTGWFSAGSTMTRVLTRSRFSIASLQVVTNGSALNEGIYFRVLDLLGIQDIVTVSAYVRGSGKVRIRVIDNPTGKQWYSQPQALTDARWTRIEVSGRITGSNDVRLYVESADTTPRAITFFVDGAQMERKPYSTTYCDGSQEGCRWNVTAYATQSTRDATSRVGGRRVPIAGPCRPNNDLYVTVLGGFGMPPIQNQTQPWSNSDGSFFQDVKTLNRTLTLSFYVKKKNLVPIGDPDLTKIHELRQQLIDVIKPNRTVGDEAFLLEYESTESDRKLYIRARYDSGLESSWDVRNEWVNSFPVRMLCVDPLWYEDDQEVASLGIRNSVSFTLPIIGVFTKTNGVWGPLKTSSGTVFSGASNFFAYAPDGTIYIATTGVTKYDGTSFTVIGSANDQVTGILVGQDGTVYAFGRFTNIGGVAINKAARYNPLTGVWSALYTGAGPNDHCSFACLANNGQIYMVGQFTAIDGVTMRCIARWDGSQWRTVGATSGVNLASVCIINNPLTNTIYFGGNFTAQIGGSANSLTGIGQIDPTTNLISSVGGGFSITGSNNVSALAIGIDGSLYAAGLFTATMNGQAVLNIAQFSGGKTWFPLGAGLTSSNPSAGITSLSIGPNGELYAAGPITGSGAKALGGVGVWFGGTWNHLEFYNEFYVANQIISVPNKDLYVSIPSPSSPTSYPATTTITNTGTYPVYPLLYYTGSGTIRFIGNNKTGQSIYLNCPVYVGEEIFFDFARGKIYSTVRGDLSYTVLAGSEIRSLYALPGDNAFSVMVTNDVGGVMQLRYTPQHWSADAVVDVDDLV